MENKVQLASMLVPVSTTRTCAPARRFYPFRLHSDWSSKYTSQENHVFWKRCHAAWPICYNQWLFSGSRPTSLL